MRYLAIDPGDRRTGLAIGDDVMRMATPLEVITTTGDAARLEAIERIVAREQPDAIVIGLPLHADGSESVSSRKARELARAMETRLGITVHLYDERLTSFEADQRMSGTGLTHGQKKARRDALAAAAILEDFLRARGQTDE